MSKESGGVKFSEKSMSTLEAVISMSSGNDDMQTNPEQGFTHSSYYLTNINSNYLQI